jgi:hypothetical protein
LLPTWATPRKHRAALKQLERLSLALENPVLYEIRDRAQLVELLYRILATAKRLHDDLKPVARQKAEIPSQPLSGRHAAAAIWLHPLIMPPGRFQLSLLEVANRS